MPRCEKCGAPIMPACFASDMRSRGGAMQDKMRQAADMIADTIMMDTTGDGEIDTVMEDIDGDGTIDIVNMDTTGDGEMDTTFVDLDGDGEMDMVISEHEISLEDETAEEFS